MARGALDAGHDDLVEQAEDLSRQVLRIAEAPRWLKAAGTDAAELSSTLSASASRARALATEATDSRGLTRVAWLEARTVVDGVADWRRRLRLALRIHAPPSHDVETILAALGPKELYLRSALIVMHRVVPLLGQLHDAEALSEASTLLHQLEQAQAGVDEAERHQAGRTAAAACATEELRRLIGATCTRWQFARALSGDTLPELDLQIIRAGVARGRGTRRGRARTEQDAGGASGAPDPSGCRDG
jgi:hypothetical protein